MTPIFIPVNTGGSGGTGGISGNLTNGEIATIVSVCTIGSLLFIYYMWVIISLMLNEYSSRKEFFKDLIPFRLFIKSVIESFRRLK